jgi:PAS domain S-box-containing protein
MAVVSFVRSAMDSLVRPADSGALHLQDMPEATLVLGHDGRIAQANELAAVLLGVARDKLPGTAFAAYCTDPDEATTLLEKARARGTMRNAALAVAHPAKGRRSVAVHATLVEAVGRTLPHVLVVLRDVSDARRAELDASRRADYHRSLLEASSDGLLAIDSDRRITDANAAAQAQTGLTRERLIGMDFPALFQDQAGARAALDRTVAEQSVVVPGLVIRHRTGTISELLFTGTVYRDADGTAVGVLVSLRDVTEARRIERERDAKDWIVAGIARLNEQFQGQISAAELSRRIISEITTYTGAQVGAFFVTDGNEGADSLTLLASHAYTRRKALSSRIAFGEGIVGQAALERKQVLITDVPDDYIRVTSGLGEATPRTLCVTPLLLEGRVVGMLELASFAPLTDSALEYLRQAAPSVAVALEAGVARERVAAALQQAQQLAAELEAQQETLRNTNAELEEQAAQLRISEQKLKSQQQEIELANTELSQKNDLLERQKSETEQARKVLAAQAEEVALASKYKSEFLANMSHELRTPLNSLLLLARSLRDNSTGNLNDEQVESATVIYDSGSDLLSLINEILDLSKIEAGKMELRPESLELEEFQRALVSQFDHMARAQGLTLAVHIAPGTPDRIVSDGQRLGQVVKNLLGNALKFTEAGGVTVTFARPAAGVDLGRSGLTAQETLAISVSDTGIGIPHDKQRIIFEAFQQADSGDRRRYGGTGLGLSISRELTALLGGEIQLVSEPGVGSTFTIYIPLRLAGTGGVEAGMATSRPVSLPTPAPSVPRAPVFATPPAAPALPMIPDDRDIVQEHDHVVLIVEDDARFAKILAGHVRERGFKCIVAGTGEDGLALARQHRPHGIVLDIQLPRMDGWAVLNALKQDISLRHIPVHVVSVEEYSTKNMRLGAIGHVSKPVGREQIDEILGRLSAASALARKRVLVVEDDEIMRRETVRIVGNGNVTVTEVGTGEAAITELRGEPFHLVVMDLGLPDMQGLELLKRLTAEHVALPPVIIHTNRELTTEEDLFLRAYAESIIIKDVRSQERLIDEVALFLHRVVRDLPEDNRRAILHLHESNEPLRGRKVLIVEDDMRTMFAMARLLAGHGVHPVKAENGGRALELLREHPDVDLVLLDMMMPVLDGYETLRRVRAQPQFETLPVVALTAKAMKEDRQRCLEAGATDYLSKPIDQDRLLSLMRVLLSR